MIDSISYGDRSMKVAGLEVKVRNAPIFDGATRVGITMLQVGYGVQVKGTWEHDYIIASEVIVKDATADPDAGTDGPTLEFAGFLEDLAGPCPSVTFVVDDTAVAAGPESDFSNGPCEHLEEGTFVKVQAQRGSDGSLLADKIEMAEVQVRGQIEVLSGACPTLMFTVDGSTVKTDASTVFEHLACSGFTEDARVEVKGSAHPNGVVKATRLKYEGP